MPLGNPTLKASNNGRLMLLTFGEQLNDDPQRRFHPTLYCQSSSMTNKFRVWTHFLKIFSAQKLQATTLSKKIAAR